MNERLREVRKYTQNYTQDKFAAFLGTTRAAIASYELGRVVPSDTFIQLLCAKCNINETWLRTGSGDMFVETDDALLGKLAHEYNMSPSQQRIMNAFLRMDEQKREMVAQSFFMFVDSLQETSPAAPSVTLLDNVSDEELELKKRQELIAIEFEAEKKGITSLASTGTSGRTKKA
ncbi:helix-turn-helix transcriptional regulator [Anaeromusa sp.]|uniref:helix-turn-helix domain-containing protein n=1 Tax=Anaeromusa sp. TaxID=1872520 RepID=UPI00261B6FCE|nr:helix-turn-helix transcriptional regulator [Anaeromusa sp.]MDD3157272.1 helix-turn-helix transcriptional regulator [Anaeromusa sp.]